jgi:protein gp37
MGEQSAIERTDSTWNPATGCTKVSPGCKFCYAERVTERWSRRKFTDIVLHPDRLELPLRWRAPRRIFVNSMSGLFHERVPFEFIDQVFEVMPRADRHIFQVLTKRADRMLQWFRERGGAPIPAHIWMCAGSCADGAVHTCEAPPSIASVMMSARTTVAHVGRRGR